MIKKHFWLLLILKTIVLLQICENRDVLLFKSTNKMEEIDFVLN